MKKILIIGSAGMLGHDLMTRGVLRNNIKLVPSTHADLDITNRDSVTKTIDSIRPDVIIIAAAYTDVDGSETNREKAIDVNAEGARNIAEVAELISAQTIYISTDYVYAGNKNIPLKEDSLIGPINVYGESKLLGEKYISTASPKNIIIRTSWLYGKNGKNFVNTIIKKAKEEKKLTVVNDQLGSPTFTADLADAIYTLIEAEAAGIINLSNSGECSWFGFTQKIVEFAGIEGIEIHPTTSKAFSRPAKRPPYSVLDCSLYTELTSKSMRNWEKALKDYIG